MSKLTDALAAPPIRAGACKLCTLIDGHPDRKSIDSALADQRWANATLARVLSDNDVIVGETAVGNHRRRCMKKPR